jgi:DNA repair protein RadD
MAFQQREYQTRTVAGVRSAYAAGARRILVVMPTGGGKTFTACSIVEGARKKGRRILWLTHRRELIRQAARSLKAVGVEHGVILAGHERRPDLPMQVASVQTLTADGEVPDGIDIIIPDEAHHIVASTWKAIIKPYPRLELLLGLTATPERGDGTPCGDVFEQMVVACSVKHLQELNASDPYTGLVPCDVIAGEKPSKDFWADPVDAYLKYTPGKRAVAFCASVAHAQEVAAAFNRRGIRAECIEGSTAPEVRQAALERLASGETKIITNVFVLTEGADIPAIECVLLARGCSVWAAWMQMIGRGLRPSPDTGKTRCTVLDLRSHVHLHGMPNDERAFSLEGAATRLLGQPMALRACPSCGCVFRPARQTAHERQPCPRCGFQLPPLPAPKVREKPAGIVTAASVVPWEEKRNTWNELVREARRKNWKPKAALMRFKGLYGHTPPAAWLKAQASGVEVQGTQRGADA